MEEKLIWMDEMYLSKFDELEIDSRIGFQEAFTEVKELEMTYSITNSESEEDNTYLSYNKVIGTSLDKELTIAFEILDYGVASNGYQTSCIDT